mmetsp:Transcript_3454/g.9664  ORF Transcript_3454/g.9664 Transcript_3454/m.9664 type:complete len:850 (-) Transcript_3454:1628-4177(-)
MVRIASPMALLLVATTASVSVNALEQQDLWSSIFHRSHYHHNATAALQQVAHPTSSWTPSVAANQKQLAVANLDSDVDQDYGVYEESEDEYYYDDDEEYDDQDDETTDSESVDRELGARGKQNKRNGTPPGKRRKKKPQPKKKRNRPGKPSGDKKKKKKERKRQQQTERDQPPPVRFAEDDDELPEDFTNLHIEIQLSDVPNFNCSGLFDGVWPDPNQKDLFNLPDNPSDEVYNTAFFNIWQDTGKLMNLRNCITEDLIPAIPEAGSFFQGTNKVQKERRKKKKRTSRAKPGSKRKKKQKPGSKRNRSKDDRMLQPDSVSEDYANVTGIENAGYQFRNSFDEEEYDDEDEYEYYDEDEEEEEDEYEYYDEDEDEDDQEENDEDEAGMEEDQDESVEMELNDEEIPHCRGAHLVSILVRTFFRTIRRDWGTMDKYRIDKFYTCTRLMMHEIYKYMSVRSWTYGIVLMLNDALFQEILEHPPNGLRYHLIDVCLEELAKVNAKARVPLTEATFLDVLEPFFGLCQTGKNDDTVHERIMEKLIDNFLENYSVVSDKALQEDDDADGNNSTSLIFRNVHVKSIGDFLFTLGSDPLTKDNYRKALYDMHKKYMRRLKKIGKDVDISEQDGSESSGDGEEEDVDDVTLDNIDDSIRFLSSETRAEMRDESEDDDLIDGDEAEEQAEKVKAETEKKESKKKKKRKSLESEPEAENNNKVTTDDSGDGKKKKKKKRKSDPEETAPEEEIVITLTEQQDAKKKERNTKKKRKEREEEEEREKKEDKSASKGSKRVSFGKKNRAKSHKASMKALRTSEPPNTKQTNPEKGILRKEPKHKSKLKGGTASRKGRQKASNYF